MSYFQTTWALQLMGDSDSVSMTLCIWMENIGDQESLLSLATNLRLLLSFGMFLAPSSPDPAFFLLLRWDMIWLTTSDTRFSFYCIWDTNVHLLRTSHTFWVMYARWMAASWFSWLFLCVASSYPKIDDGGHFALIYHGWFSLSWTFEWSSCQTKIIKETKISFFQYEKSMNKTPLPVYHHVELFNAI